TEIYTLALHDALPISLTGVYWQYSWQCHAVKAFLPFFQGIPARNTELHRAYPGWLVGKTLSCLHMTIYATKINLRMVPKLVAYKTIPQKVSNCCILLL